MFIPPPGGCDFRRLRLISNPPDLPIQLIVDGCEPLCCAILAQIDRQISRFTVYHPRFSPYSILKLRAFGLKPLLS
jgi:hypothetical protein